MRIRKRSKSRASPAFFDHLRLWAALAVLAGAIVLYLNRMEACTTAEEKAHGPYSFFPGLQLDDLPLAAREKLALLLNHRYCNCGCLLSLASCRNNHTSCHTSHRVGQEMVEQAQKEIRTAN